MNILIEKQPNVIYKRWHLHLLDIKHQPFIWNKNTITAFEIFRQFTPKIFIGTTATLDRAIIKNLLKTRPKIILQGTTNEFIRKLEQNFVYQIKELDPLIISPEPLENFNKWENLGYQIKHVPFTFDNKTHRLGKKRSEFLCDLLYIGPLTEAAKQILVPLSYKYIVKIFTNDYMPIPQILGNLPENLHSDAYFSAKFTLNVEKNTDLPYNIVYSGGRLISTVTVDNLHTNGYIQAPNVEIIDQKINYWFNEPKASLKLNIINYQTILKELI